MWAMVLVCFLRNGLQGMSRQPPSCKMLLSRPTNDYQREEIWKDLASLNLMLGRAWDASTRQWSASTVSPVKDYYGSSGGAYSYGAMTNGSMTGEAAQALAGKLLQQKKDQAANYGSDGVNWYEIPKVCWKVNPESRQMQISGRTLTAGRFLICSLIMKWRR